MTMSRRKLSVLSSISGRGTFVSSNEEIKLKYLFSNLHFSSYSKKYSKQSDIDKDKKQKIKVNNLKKIAKEHFEQNGRHFLCRKKNITSNRMCTTLWYCLQNFVRISFLV
jgi:hypothetical protein